MKSLPYYLVFQVPLSVVAGYLLGGAFTFVTLILVFGIMPVMDLLIGASSRNPSPGEEQRLKDSLPHKLVTWLAVPVQVGMVLWGAFAASCGTMSPLELAGFTLSMGTSSGVLGINLSHELQHRVNNGFEPLLSRIMLWTAAYMHWAVEHVAGHHRSVATPADPATARKGESFYAFWPRTVFGGFRDAWDIEKRRLGKKGAPLWGAQNRVLRYTAAEAALVLAILVLLGPAASAYFFAQSLIAITFLEVVNYIEHYGLLRREMSPGVYEPVDVTHSWNSSTILSNLILFNLQRHSDHHAEPGRRYQVLRHFDRSPQLPTGYAGMILLAVVPPLWRRVMDPKVPGGMEASASIGLPR
jgi:alkane 1-monooxygenase